MAMGTRTRARQPSMWVATTDFPTAANNPFYTRLNQLLREQRFDDFAEAECATFYADTMGRPGLPPGIYFRLLLIGYFGAGLVSKRLLYLLGQDGPRYARAKAARSWRSAFSAIPTPDPQAASREEAHDDCRWNTVA